MESSSVPPSPGRERRPIPEAGPYFCPRCGRVAPEGPTLCRECGEALASQGYCGVCESHWPLAAGAPCPKHELALEPAGVRTGVRRFSGGVEKWVTLRSF